jgi:hypothetical protein
MCGVGTGWRAGGGFGSAVVAECIHGTKEALVRLRVVRWGSGDYWGRFTGSVAARRVYRMGRRENTQKSG